MDALRLHMRHAWRSLRRNPGFSAAAVLTLGLGIGAVTAIFTVVDSVVLRPLPYPAADRLVHIEHPVPGENPDWKWGMTEAGYFYFHEHNRTFEDLAVYSTSRLSLAGEGTAEQVDAAQVSASVFSVLGARPAAGRLLVEADNLDPNAPVSVGVLGYDFWRTRFDADPAMVGRTILLEGRPVEIVGVAPAGFTLPDHPTQLFLPARISPANQPVNWHRFQAIGRLAPGVSIAEAHTDLDRLKERFPEALPEAYYAGFMERTGFAVEVEPLRAQVVGDLDRMLWILLAGVGIVLLIACANVANLFLVRMESRRREIAVRTALGATTRDIVRGYVSESALLATLAAGLALLLSYAGIQLLLRVAPADIPRLGEIGLGWASVALALGAGLLAALAFGALPLFSGAPGTAALRQSARSMTASRREHRLRQTFVVAEVALALVLLASAGLMLRTFDNLRSIDPGVEPEGVLTVQVALPMTSYRGDVAVAGFYRELTERVGALPGVTAAGATQSLALDGGAGCAVVFTDDQAAAARNEGCWVAPLRVTPGYFEVMGIPVEGRVPTWNEVQAASGEMVISRAVADKLWPGEDPVGKGLRGNGAEPPFYRIVGVAGDVRATGLTEPPTPRAYFPMVAMENSGLWSAPTSMTVVAKAAVADPQSLAPAIRQIVRDMDPTVPVGSIRTMDDVIASSMAQTTFAMLLLGIAAAVALLLGVIGLYGVIAYIVERRRSEIGIRMALGARRGQVAGLIVRQSLVVVGTGIALGLWAAVLTTGALQSLLFEVEPADPVVLGGVSLVLALVALAASWLPARRASRVDPMTALRNE